MIYEEVDASRFSRDRQQLFVPALIALNAYWLGVVSTTEYIVLLHIVHRTLRFGRASSSIAYRHIINGVADADTGEVVMAPTKLSRHTVVKAYASLERYGLIKVTRTSTESGADLTNKVEINFTALLSPTAVAEQFEGIAMLRVSKKRRNEADQNGGLAKNSMGAKVHTNRNSKPINVSTKVDNRVRGFDSAEEALAHVASVHRVRRERAVKSISSGLTIAGARAAWQEATLRHYPSIPVTVITAKEFAMLKRGLGTLLATDDLIVFLDWVAEQWGSLRSNELAWLNSKSQNMPSAPDLNVVARFAKHFVKAYASYKANATAHQRARSDRMAELEQQVAAVNREAQLAKDALAKMAVKQAYYSPLHARRVRSVRSLSSEIQEAESTYADGELPEWGGK